MRIEFTSQKQTLIADHIIRCKIGLNVFHVSINGDVVDVYAPNDKVTCYEVDEKKMEKSNG